MLKLRKVAITGGVACGKSLVRKYLAELGAIAVDADAIVHQLLTPETQLGKKIIELFGTGIIVNGKISRERIAKKAFLNPKLLRSLEELLHPPVYEEIERRFQDESKRPDAPPLFVAEVPLLFESGGEVFFDVTVAIVANREKCWERYRTATGNEREDFDRRMARQLNEEEKAKRADYVIRNDSTSKELRESVVSLYGMLCGAEVKKSKG